jgi:hypothetical protein
MIFILCPLKINVVIPMEETGSSNGTATEAALAIGAAALLIAGFFAVTQFGASFSGAMAAASGMASRAAAAVPQSQPEITVLFISVPECMACADYADAIASIQGLPSTQVNFREADYASPEAQAIIAARGIQTLPALYVTGDASRLATVSSGFGVQVQDGAAVIESNPPYYSVPAGRVVGIVDVLLINDSTCAECYPVGQIPNLLMQQGVAVGGIALYDINSTEGAAAAGEYALTTAPAVLLGADIEYYPETFESIRDYTTRNSDGSYRLDFILPYRDISNGTDGPVRGVVDVIYLNDSTCAECYTVSDHDQAFISLGLVVGNRSFEDISSPEGSALLLRYNISVAPTVLLSPDAELYDSIQNVWPTVGTVEGDGWLVFRDASVVGTYRNLTSGQVVTPPGFE